MAICGWCGEDMLTAKSCQLNEMIINGVTYKPVKYGDESGDCHDCGVEKGGYHHPGCDIEQCPVCNGQLISCGCLDEEEFD